MCSDHCGVKLRLKKCGSLSPVGLESNELVYEQTRHAALNGAVFDRTLRPVDFQGLERSVLLRELQEKWNAADTSRIAPSILPKISLRP
jgi:hypothetical protein